MTYNLSASVVQLRRPSPFRAPRDPEAARAAAEAAMRKLEDVLSQISDWIHFDCIPLGQITAAAVETDNALNTALANGAALPAEHRVALCEASDELTRVCEAAQTELVGVLQKHLAQLSVRVFGWRTA